MATKEPTRAAMLLNHVGCQLHLCSRTSPPSTRVTSPAMFSWVGAIKHWWNSASVALRALFIKSPSILQAHKNYFETILCEFERRHLQLPCRQMNDFLLEAAPHRYGRKYCAMWSQRKLLKCGHNSPMHWFRIVINPDSLPRLIHGHAVVWRAPVSRA